MRLCFLGGVPIVDIYFIRGVCVKILCVFSCAEIQFNVGRSPVVAF